jgi:hypothetical protein
MLVSLSGAMTDQMTHEETLVRTAYAKLAYALEQGVIGQLAMEASGVPTPKEHAGLNSDQRIAAAQITLSLSDFVVGDGREILDRRAVDLISPAVGEVLEVVGGSYNYSESGRVTSWYRPEARWRPARALPPELLEATLADFYELQWHQKRPDALWLRYASYSVTVSFQGRTRGPYKALFMFGHDADGNEVVEPEDATIDATGLASAMHEHLFADAFVLTRLRTHALVSNWLYERQMPAPSCSAVHGDVCCDLTKLRCGPKQVDVEEGLSRPLPEGPPSKR